MKLKWMPEYMEPEIGRYDCYAVLPFGLEIHIRQHGWHGSWQIWGPGNWLDRMKINECHPNKKSAIIEAERYITEELQDWMGTYENNLLP